MKRVLILGGTGDATKLAAKISEYSTAEVITSLAGRTAQPSQFPGKIHIGGFGGASGLAHYLREEEIDILLDATHPFAAQISWNAAIAAQETEIPHLMLIRPAWPKLPADHWIEVQSIESAPSALPDSAQRVFLSIGQQQLAPFTPLKDIWFLMRSIDPPNPCTPLPRGKILLERGPFSLEHERNLLQEYQIDAIVSKNSGGDATYAKIIAARELELPVIMVQRPKPPAGEVVLEIASALTWIEKYLTPA